MARISNFPLDDNVGLNDILVGSEYNGIGANNRPIYVTKNYRIGDLSNFFGLNVDTVAVNANKLSSLATFNADGSLASLQNATVSLINTATTAAGFATASSVTAVGSRVDVIMPGGGSTVSEAFANQVFTTTTNSDFAEASEVTEIKSQFTYNGDDINGLADGTIISTATNTARNTAIATANKASATRENNLTANVQKVFKQNSAPSVTLATQMTANVNSAITDSVDLVIDGQSSGTIVEGMVITGSGISGDVVVITVTNQNTLVLSSPQTLANNTVLTFNKAQSPPVNSLWYDTTDVSRVVKNAETGADTTTSVPGNILHVLTATGSSPYYSWVENPDALLATQASVNTTASATADINGKLSSRYGVKVTAGGVFAGMELLANSDDTGAVSDIIFTSTNFKIHTISGTTVSNVAPFTVSGNTVSINGNLEIGGTSMSTLKSNAATGAGALQPGNAASDINSNTTSISGGKIRTGVIESTGYAYTSGNFSTAGAQINLDNGLIRSKNFLIDTSGNVFFNGEVTSTSGSIGGFTIGSTAISTSNKTSLADNDAGVYLGTDGIALGTNSPFKVTAAGVITASSGTIGGWTLGTAGLYNGRNSITSTTAGVFIGQTGIAIGTTGAPTFKVTSAGVLNATGATISGSITVTNTGDFAPTDAQANDPNQNNPSSYDFGPDATFDLAAVSTPTNNGLYIGSDKFGFYNSGWKTYMDSSGNFYLNGTNGSLAWNSTSDTLAITGAITCTSISFNSGVTVPNTSVSGLGSFATKSTLAYSEVTERPTIPSGTLASLDAIDAVHINQDAVTAPKIQAGAIIAGKIQAGAIVANDIAADTITATNISSLNFSGKNAIFDQGTIGGFNLGANVFKSTNDAIEINTGSNPYFQINDTDGTPRVVISSSNSVANPASTATITSDYNTGTVGSISITGSGSVSGKTGKYYRYNVSAYQGKTITFSLTINPGAISISNNGAGSYSCYWTAGVYTNTTASTAPMALSSSQTKSSTSSSSLSTTDPGNKAVKITLAVPENEVWVYVMFTAGISSYNSPSNRTITVNHATAVASPTGSFSIDKVEITKAGLLVAVNTNQFFRIDRDQNSNTDPFIESKGYWHHGGGKMSIQTTTDDGIIAAGALTENYDSTIFNPYSNTSWSESAYVTRDFNYMVAQSNHNGTAINACIIRGDGRITTAAGSTLTSDRRIKKDIVDATSKLSDILKLKVRNFKYKLDKIPWGADQKLIGFIAQEFEEVFPSMVSDVFFNQNEETGEKEYIKSICESKLIPILTKGMQEQQAIIESQKTLIDNLTERVTALEG